MLGAERADLAPMRLMLLEEDGDDGLDGDEGDKPRTRGRKPATLPAWIQLTPVGPEVNGRDGRAFEIGDPAKVLKRTAPELPMLIDWDHDSMWGSTKAAAWVDDIRFVAIGEETPDFSEAGFWGHVERWTPEGEDDVRNFRFRMLSPVIRHQFREPEIEGDDPPLPLLLNFESIALTNRPNLRMVSLNTDGAGGAEAFAMSEEEMAELVTLLGLEEGSDAAAILEAVKALLEPDEEPTEEDANRRADLESALTANRVLLVDLAAARKLLGEHTAAATAADTATQTALVDTAIEDGRAAASMRDDLIRLATSDRTEDREMYGRLTATKIAGAPRGKVTQTHGEIQPGGSKVKRVGDHREVIAALSEEDRFSYLTFTRGCGYSHERALEMIAEG